MNWKRSLGIVVGILVLGVLLALKSCQKVTPGMVGVVYSPSGGVKEHTLSQGWNFVSPLNKVSMYSVATEQAYLSRDTREGSRDDESFMVVTKDGKTVNVDLEYSYRFDEARVAELFTRFRGRDGESIEKTYIRGKIKAYVNEVSAKFSVLEIYGEKRAQLNREVFEHVRDIFAKDGIIIESTNFSRIALDEATEQAIQKRVNSQQELERQKIEKQKAEIEAQRLLVISNSIAERKIVEAKAEAERITTLAQAEAEANRLKLKSITKELIEYEKVNKWNGQLPTVTGGANPILDMRQSN